MPLAIVAFLIVIAVPFLLLLSLCTLAVQAVHEAERLYGHTSQTRKGLSPLKRTIRGGTAADRKKPGSVERKPVPASRQLLT